MSVHARACVSGRVADEWHPSSQHLNALSLSYTLTYTDSVVCNMCVVTQMATHVFGYKKCCDCDKGAFCSSNV